MVNYFLSHHLNSTVHLLLQNQKSKKTIYQRSDIKTKGLAELLKSSSEGRNYKRRNLHRIGNAYCFNSVVYKNVCIIEAHVEFIFVYIAVTVRCLCE